MASRNSLFRISFITLIVLARGLTATPCDDHVEYGAKDWIAKDWIEVSRIITATPFDIEVLPGADDWTPGEAVIPTKNDRYRAHKLLVGLP